MGLMSTSCDVKFDNHSYKWITLVFERGSDNKSSLKKKFGKHCTSGIQSLAALWPSLYSALFDGIIILS